MEEEVYEIAACTTAYLTDLKLDDANVVEFYFIML